MSLTRILLEIKKDGHIFKFYKVIISPLKFMLMLEFVYWSTVN